MTKKQLIDAARFHYTPKRYKECSFYYEIDLVSEVEKALGKQKE